VALAAALPSLPYACGLATTAMLTRDLSREPMTPVDGRLSARRVRPDDDLLEAASAEPSVAAGWLARVARCAAVLRDRSA
jgi:O-succinylbenzoate synthase